MLAPETFEGGGHFVIPVSRWLLLRRRIKLSDAGEGGSGTAN
jgi:hypothetical protein